MKRLADSSEKQADILRAIQGRQAAAGTIINLFIVLQSLLIYTNPTDIRRQLIPEVPAESSGAWDPLLTCYQNHINVNTERWKGSIDVLLIFVSIHRLFGDW